WMQRKRLADRPALDVFLDDALHDLAVATHRVAVKGWQQALARAQVWLLVKHQHRALAEHGRQQPVAIAGVIHRGITREDLLDQLRVVNAYRRAPRQRADRKHRPVLALGGSEEG